MNGILKERITVMLHHGHGRARRHTRPCKITSKERSGNIAQAVYMYTATQATEVKC